MITSNTDKKTFINLLYMRNWKIANPDQAIYNTNNFDSISSAIYPDNSRFLVELIQNCDDSSFELNNLEMTFTILEDIIIISHKGKAFDEADIKSLCSSGTSTKLKNPKYTGYKGIGFKSVFSNSEKVAIISNGFQFKFEKDFFTPDECWQDEWGLMTPEMRTEIKKPWQIIPLWIEENEIEKEILKTCQNYSVNFVIYFKKKNKFNLCRNFIYEIEKDPLHFLFLKSKNIKLSIYEKETKVKELTKLEYDRKSAITALITDNKIFSFYNVKTFTIPFPKFSNEELETLGDDKEMPKKLLNSHSFEISFAVQLKETTRNIYQVIQIPEDKRLIYCFLPTKQNFNFPFLINSNFILDASRTQIKDHLWNEKIFSLIPEYIQKFTYEHIFSTFGNSYAECLLSGVNITMPKLKHNFNENNQKIKINEIMIKTVGDKKPLKDCFYNTIDLVFTNQNNNIKIEDQNIDLQMGNQKIENIESFFSNIYGMYKMIYLENYFFEKYNLEYNNNSEIPKEDLKYIQILSNFYQQRYKIIQNTEIILFLFSKQYMNSYTPDICYKVLNNICLANLQEEFKRINPPIFMDSNDKFKTANEIQFYNYNNISEDKKFIFDLIKEKSTKFDLNQNLKNMFDFNEGFRILIELGVSVINDSDYIEKVIPLLDLIYRKENSISLIRLIFKFWMKIKKDSTEEKELIKKISQLHYITEDDDFCHTHSVNIGEFYNDKFPYFPPWGVSRNYYYEGSEKSDWFEFFKKIGFVYDDRVLKKNINYKILHQTPYFTNDYVDLVKKEIYTEEELFSIDIFPSIIHLYNNGTDKEIRDYFFKYYVSTEKEGIKFGLRTKKSKLPNFLIWYTLKNKKLIPTNKGELKNIDDVYSPEVLENETQNLPNNKKKIIQDFLMKVLNYPDIYLPNQMVEEKIIINSRLNINDRIAIMKIIIEKCQTRIKEKEILKEFFLEQLSIISSEKPNEKINCELLDNDFEFRSPNQLYFIESKEFSHIISDQIKNTLKKLKIPSLDQIKIKSYLKFCQVNGVKIYSVDNIKIKTTEENSNDNFSNVLINKNFSKYFMQILEKKMPNAKITEKEISANLSKIKFISCSKIEANHENECFELICYFKKEARFTKLLYTRSEIYTSWSHPTILYFISKYLANYLGFPVLCLEINTLLKLESIYEIEQWITYGCHNNNF